MNNYYQIRNKYKFKINIKILNQYNPIFYNTTIHDKLEISIYNPYALDWVINHPNYINQINYYIFLDNYPLIYDYIISKDFYKKLINYKDNYPELINYWNMWLNINPFADKILLANYDMIDFNFLSLNPKCFDIYDQIINLEEYDEILDYLNEDLISANPSIITYDYKRIKENNKEINEEILMEVYKPERIHNYLKYHDNLDNYMN